MKTHNRVAAKQLRRFAQECEELADVLETYDPESRAAADCAEQVVRHGQDWLKRAEEQED